MIKNSTLLLAFVTATLGAVVIFAPNATASISGFKAGNIINDTVMSAANSMSTSDIQNFLNSKVPNCDTNGQQNSEMNNYGVPDYNGNGSIQRWEWGKKKYGQTTFKCLRNFTQNGKSAARIIRDTAQEFTISPKVLIVLLQKEQGLVTDTWPLNIQYRSATGYGCPDTAACDSDYYGFTNQIRWAARMFRAILNDSPSWYTPYILGNNQIPWNPNTSVCGYSTVNIENRATQALYNYTPYRPNQAALNAGYGMGNSCSSYGNRNFYLYFTDWFGSTSVPMFKISGENTIYLNYGDMYYAIPSPEILRAWGLEGKRVALVNASQIASYTRGPDLSRAAKFGTGDTVYLVDKGKIHPVPNWSTLGLYGYSGADVRTYTDNNMKSLLSTKGILTALAGTNNGAVFHLDNNGKHVFADYKTFSSRASSLAGTSQYYTFSDELIGSITSSYPILLDGSTVKVRNSTGIYLYDNDTLLSFTPDSWQAWGAKVDYRYSSTSLEQMPKGGIVPLFIDVESTHYLVNKGRSHKFTSSMQSEWGLIDDDFEQLSSRSLSRLSKSRDTGKLIQRSNGAVFLVDNGKRLLVPSGQDFNAFGFQWKNVMTLSDTAINKVSSDGYLAFAPGSLVRTPNGTVSLVASNLAVHHIPSLETFNNFGFQWKNVRSVPANALDGYSNSVLASLVESSDGKYYLADRGQLLFVDSATYSSSQYDFASTPTSTIDSATVSKLNTKGTLTQFVQGDSPLVYKIINGEKRPVSSSVSLYENGGSWEEVTRVSDGFLDSLPTGSTL